MDKKPLLVRHIVGEDRNRTIDFVLHEGDTVVCRICQQKIVLSKNNVYRDNEGMDIILCKNKVSKDGRTRYCNCKTPAVFYFG